MKGVIGMEEPFGFAIEGAKSDADIGVGIGDAFLDVLFGKGEAGGLRERGSG